MTVNCKNSVIKFESFYSQFGLKKSSDVLLA